MNASGPALDGSYGPHVLVENVDHPVLADADHHHIERVLRLRPGDAITIGDGAGRWRPCRFGPELEPVAEPFWIERRPPELTVAFALIKGGRPELVVQKLTELGIDRIVPFIAARSIVRWDPDKAQRNAERLQRVAREAVMQSRRAWVPIVEPVSAFTEVAARPGAALADLRGGPLTAEHSVVLVGPEGGWDDDERGVGIPRVAFSEAVLRAETAAIAAGTLMDWARARVG